MTSAPSPNPINSLRPKALRIRRPKLRSPEEDEQAMQLRADLLLGYCVGFGLRVSGSGLYLNNITSFKCPLGVREIRHTNISIRVPLRSED